tara:strand:- start:570 stop:842 length:273 start_codon:yes stop_codon:yes gene_type:complete
MRKIKAKRLKVIEHKSLYFNSLIKLKDLDELKNIEKIDNPIEIPSIYEIDLRITLFKSLIFKYKTMNIRKNIKSISNNDLMKIHKIILIG